MAKILLSPKTLIPYGGKKHSLGQQFYAEAADAQRFLDEDKAERVAPQVAAKATKASRSAAEDARADGDAPEAGDPSGTTAVVTVS